jgi:hypothetical protein
VGKPLPGEASAALEVGCDDGSTNHVDSNVFDRDSSVTTCTLTDGSTGIIFPTSVATVAIF